MDQIDLRRALVQELLANAFRLTGFASLFKGQAVGPVFLELAQARGGLVGLILHDFPDAEMPGWFNEPRGAGFDRVTMEVEALGAYGSEAAVRFAWKMDEELSALIAEMPEDLLPPALTEHIFAAIGAGTRRLQREAFTLRASAGSLGFQTKGLDPANPRPRPPHIVEVWFGTNREHVAGEGRAAEFSNTRTDGLTFGSCVVAIPASHPIGGGQPSLFKRVFGALPFAVKDTTVLTEADFWASARARLQENELEPGDAVVFLHGYRVSFENAAVSAAQLAADLNIPGLTAFFSWPSRGNVFQYMSDEASIEASEIQITEFLTRFASRSGARKVHIVAHSMGNRGLLKAVNRMAHHVAAMTGVVFGQIILAAPDVDVGTFRQHSDAYKAVAEGTTLYLSARDWAVRLSGFLHSADRVGLAPPVTVVRDVHTISVTNVDLSLLGHGYFTTSRVVLTDIFQVLTTASPPSRRATLRLVKTADGQDYWELAA